MPKQNRTEQISRTQLCQEELRYKSASLSLTAKVKTIFSNFIFQNKQIDSEEIFAEFDKKCIGLELLTAALMACMNRRNNPSRKTCFNVVMGT